MKSYVIGDIHGCHYALESLLDTMGPVSGDRIVFLGDYVSWGPESVEVLRRVRGLVEDSDLHVMALRGDHEEMLLATLAHGFRRVPVPYFYRREPPFWEVYRCLGGQETVAALQGMDPDEAAGLVAFLAERTAPHTRFSVDGRDFLAVHAGLDARQADINMQPLEALLFARDWEGLFLARHAVEPVAFERIFYGHRPVIEAGEPAGPLMNLDAGCVYGGRLLGYCVEDDRIHAAKGRSHNRRYMLNPQRYEFRS
jgi:serine/threonine protein phosphatase 1